MALAEIRQGRTRVKNPVTKMARRKRDASAEVHSNFVCAPNAAKLLLAVRRRRKLAATRRAWQNFCRQLSRPTASYHGAR